MKVLFLTDPKPDYLADQIYTGLCKVLGYEAVIDFPYKPIYHEPAARVHYLPQNPGHQYVADEIGGCLEKHEFDIGIISSLRTNALRIAESLASKGRLPPLVVLDGEDDADLKQDFFKSLGARLYFKRECRNAPDSRRPQPAWRTRSKRELAGQVFPLPFSVILETIPPADTAVRSLDISYAGRASHRKRVRAVKLLQEASDIRFGGGIYAEPTDRRSKLAIGTVTSLLAKLVGDPRVSAKQRGTKLTPPEYYRLLRGSKMALSIRGGGFDTLRYWEIVACGALLISEAPDIAIPNNFKHRKQAIFCRPDLKDLVPLVRYYRDHDEERKAIAAEGYAHLLKYHTCERRAEYFLEICRKNL